MKIENEKNNVKKSKLLIYLIIYKVVIELIYVLVINPLYGYTKLNLEMNFIKAIESYLLLIILVIFFPKNKNYPSFSLYFILSIFIYIPLGSYMWLADQSSLYYIFVVISFIIIAGIIKIKKINLKSNFHASLSIFNLIYIVYFIVTIYLIVIRGGIDLRAISLDEIYSLRSEQDINGLNGYLLNWSAKVFCPFFIAFYLYKKNYLLVFLTMALQMIMFLSYGYKAYLFSIIMLVFVLSSTRKDNFEKKFSQGITYTIIISYLMYILFSSTTLINTIAFRLIYVPVQIQYQYFDYFNKFEKMNFSQNIIGKILNIEDNFNQPISFVISMYYQGVISNSNTGVFSDAFANGGFTLMLIYSILIGAIFYLIDVLTNKIPLKYTVASLSYLMFVLNDNSLLTSLLTGGLALMILLLFLFNTHIRKNEEI